MQRKYRLKFKKKSNKEKEPISKKKIIISLLLIFFAFFGSFIIFVILQFALNSETPMVVVISDSMKPTINKGDLLFVQGRDPEDIEEGDIIVFDAHDLWSGAPDEPIVHRVVDIHKHDGKFYFNTKGDNNAKRDEEPIPGHRVKGVVCGRVPYIGWIKIVMTDYGLFIPILLILAVPLIVSIIYDIFKGEEEEEKEKIEKAEDMDKEIEIEEERIRIEKIERKDESKDDFDF
jgi:signal peptidase